MSEASSPHSSFQRIYFDRDPLPDLETLIGRYPTEEFQSPSRSTVALVSLVANAPSILCDVLRTCGFSDDAYLHFEFKVKPPQGLGEASHTDLMVPSGFSYATTFVFAVESGADIRPRPLVMDRNIGDSLSGVLGESVADDQYSLRQAYYTYEAARARVATGYSLYCADIDRWADALQPKCTACQLEQFLFEKDVFWSRIRR